MYYSWFSVDVFEIWHDSAKQALGIPHPNCNGATGQIDKDAQWTTAYTEAVVVTENDVRAYVEDRIAKLVPEDLGVPSEPPQASGPIDL